RPQPVLVELLLGDPRFAVLLIPSSVIGLERFPVCCYVSLVVFAPSFRVLRVVQPFPRKVIFAIALTPGGAAPVVLIAVPLAVLLDPLAVLRVVQPVGLALGLGVLVCHCVPPQG